MRTPGQRRAELVYRIHAQARVASKDGDGPKGEALHYVGHLIDEFGPRCRDLRTPELVRDFMVQTNRHFENPDHLAKVIADLRI